MASPDPSHHLHVQFQHTRMQQVIWDFSALLFKVLQTLRIFQVVLAVVPCVSGFLRQMCKARRLTGFNVASLIH